MTRHPCHGLTKEAVAAFERIAVNDPPGASVQTLQTLLDGGLIERMGMGTLHRAQVYAVPLRHHMAWCAWCDGNIPDGDAP